MTSRRATVVAAVVPLVLFFGALTAQAHWKTTAAGTGSAQAGTWATSLLTLTPTCPASGKKNFNVNVSAARANTSGSLVVTLTVPVADGDFNNSQSTTRTISAGNTSTGNVPLHLINNSPGATVVTFSAPGYNNATCSVTRTNNS